MLSVIVPTRENERTLRRLLTSVRSSAAVAEIIVVDNFSEDATPRIARECGARLISAGPERSAQRNVGLSAARLPAVVFLDSDMIAGEGVLDETDELLAAGADAVVLTEHSIGEGYWAAVRRLERSCYQGDEDLEACRAFRSDFVRGLGGYDENLAAFEDWDLTIRARGAGARIERTIRHVLHDEGRLALHGAVAKKARYGAWERAYRAKQPHAAARQLSIRHRLRPFLRNWHVLGRHPHLTLGIVILKGLEFAASRRPHRDHET